MTIAIDADDMAAVRKRLRSALDDLGQARLRFPGAAAFGPPILGSAVESFAAAAQRELEAIGERWESFGTGVQGTLDAMADVEDEITSSLHRMESEALGVGRRAMEPGT